VEAEARLRRGWVEPALSREFHGLGLAVSEVQAQSKRSPRGVKERLKHLSDITHGARALAQRREPIASAYRIFFRQIGIDPENFRPPAEAAMLERLRAGRFKSRNTLDDALTVAIVETGVPVRAFDGDKVQGDLGLRVSQPEEKLGGDGPQLPDGTIVIADERHAVALIFGDTASGLGVSPDTRRMVLCAIQVPGVPNISVEEALWICSDILTSS
jgi:DNA/RNA-binding domain of Phe-tRNA-synthetase-like protein